MVVLVKMVSTELCARKISASTVFAKMEVFAPLESTLKDASAQLVSLDTTVKLMFAGLTFVKMVEFAIHQTTQLWDVNVLLASQDKTALVLR